MASAGQRRRAFARKRWREPRRIRRGDRIFDAARFLLRADADLSAKSSSPSRRRAPSRAASSEAMTTSILRRKVRSASRRALLPARRTAFHDQLSHALSRIYRGAHALSRPISLMPCCDAFIIAVRGVMVSTQSSSAGTRRAWIPPLEACGRGASITNYFIPAPAIDLDLPRPIFLYAGRLAIEKNIEAFLALDLPGEQSDRRRRSGASASAGGLSESAFPRHQDRRRTRDALCQLRTCSYFRAAPTRSAWCCSKRWPAVCRSRPIPSLDLAT